MLDDNKFGIGGGILAAILGYFIGGPIGALIGLLLGGLAGSLLGDSNGVMSGLMGGPQQTPGGQARPQGGPGQGQAAGAPGAAPQAPPITAPLMGNAQVVPAQANAAGPLTGAPTGTVTVNEVANGQVVRQFTGTIDPATRKFNVTTVGTPLPDGSGRMAVAQLDGQAGRPGPVALDIAQNGQVSLNNPALAAVRTAGDAAVAGYNTQKNLTVTAAPSVAGPGGTPPADPNRVTVTLDPVRRNGKSYVVTMVGTVSNGQVVFNSATVTEDGQPIRSANGQPVTVPVSGSVPLTATGGQITLNQGDVDNLANNKVTSAIDARTNENARIAAARTAEATQITTAINAGGNASEGALNFQNIVMNKFKAAGAADIPASMAADVVGEYYRNAANRNKTPEQAATDLRAALANRPGITPEAINSVVSDIQANHNAIKDALNNKAVTVPMAPGTGNTVNIPRNMPAAPAPGAPVVPPPAPVPPAPPGPGGPGGP